MPAASKSLHCCDTPRTPNALNHFLDLAYRGRSDYASNGEKSARRLALTILDHATALDSLATDGLIEFVRAAQSHPESMRRIVG